MILGALESGEAPLYNPYLDVSRSFIRKKTVAWKKNVTLIAKSRSERGEVMNSSELWNDTVCGLCPKGTKKIRKLLVDRVLVNQGVCLRGLSGARS